MEALRAAPQLEYLFSLGTPYEETHSGRHFPSRTARWRAFWEWVVTHPPLRCFAFDISSQEDSGGEEPAATPGSFVHVLLMLHHRRPTLQLRRIDLCWPGMYGMEALEHNFFVEVTTCADIPAGPGISCIHT